MPDFAKVAIDTNVFQRLRSIDGDCSLTALIVDAHGIEGIADHGQLEQMDYCPGVRQILGDHGVTDEAVAEFSIAYSGRYSLPRLARDPIDLKLLVFVKSTDGALLVSCDRRLLQLCDEQELPHTCFKAAIETVDRSVGGLFEEDGYNTATMFDSSPDQPDPFFHYQCNTRCPACDSKEACPTRKRPPAR